MCSKIGTIKSTKSSCGQIDRLKEAIGSADAIVVGAGAGLSASAGFTYDAQRFRRYFSDFEETYGLHDMYTGGFYPYNTPQEYWAYWSRYIAVNRYQNPPKPVYRQLLALVQDKDYFVITTNVDHCFQKAGFDKKRLFYTQGDYGLLQCSQPCRQVTFDNEELIDAMVKRQKNMRVPSELLPVCPYCGRPMTMNLRSDNRFVEDEGWHRAAQRYENFLRSKTDRRLLFLELGVGYNTPGIIKVPFWQMTAQNSKAVYACINVAQAECPGNIKERALCINQDIGETLLELSQV
ncbi:MAG: SIR2 family NAD-dependent protein deacylase [Oscillospiraceae bacterium]